MSLFSNPFLKIARKVVDQVLSQLKKLVQQVQDLAYSPMRAMAQEVASGALGWKGESADAFVRVVSNLLVPQTSQIQEQINTYHSNLQKAVNIIEQADIRARQRGNSLADIFQQIIR